MITRGDLPSIWEVAHPELEEFILTTTIPARLDAEAPKRILLVDDEPVVLEALEAVLALKGHEVVLADCGQAALRALAEDRFDLIFLDLLLPDVGGAAILQAIKGRDPQPMVVLVTGFPHHEDAIAALECGQVLLLPKPIKLSEIDSLLRAVFKG
jgi:DNA-binding NtrC family response regulator